MATVVTSSAPQYLLEVGGTPVGSLKRFSGLGMAAEIMQNNAAGAPAPAKHVSNIKWTPGRATVGMGMGKGLYDWMKASFDKGYASMNGAFTVADPNGKVQSVQAFYNAQITAVTVPECNATSKDAGLFDIVFEAEQVKWALGGGEQINSKIGRLPRQWVRANFKVSVGSLPCARVAKVDAFTWRCVLTGSDSDRFGQRTAQVTVPDITLTIGMADYPAWAEAARAWFVDGKHLEANEMPARITLLDPTLAEAKALGWIDLGHVGFKAFSMPDAEPGKASAPTFTVTLYAETMALTIKALEA